MTTENNTAQERKAPPAAATAAAVAADSRHRDDDDDNSRIIVTRRPAHSEQQQLQQGRYTSNTGSSVNEVVEGDGLDSISHWIQSIPPAHVPVLQHMREYRDLLQAFHGLQREHEKLVAWQSRHMRDNNINDINNDDDLIDDLTIAMMMSSTSSSTASTSFSFLQFLASDDVILKIFDFLEAVSLGQVMQTCNRFRELVIRNAQRRTTVNSSISCRERQLSNVLQLLRAQEQIQGIAMNNNNNNNNGRRVGPFVRIPTLLLSRCVLVTNAGDAEYNGIYCCTGSNGNGFVFTKPREPFQRVIVQRRQLQRHSNSNAEEAQQQSSSTGDPDTDIIAAGEGAASNIDNDDNETNDNDDDADNVNRNHHLLRCIIAKRFSNETLLWYFSKEVVVATTEHQQHDQQQQQPGQQGESSQSIRAAGSREITQLYSFWARLSQLGDATPDVCRYPSQTSILSRSGEGWQSLATTRDTTPPTVELIN